MIRYEIDYYDDVSKIKETLKRIADALEAGNVTKAKEISGENTGLLSAKAILDSVKVITDDYASKHPVDKLQGAKIIPLTITNEISESDLQLKDDEYFDTIFAERELKDELSQLAIDHYGQEIMPADDTFENSSSTANDTAAETSDNTPIEKSDTPTFTDDDIPF